MDLADDVINPVQRNKELLLIEFAAELERKREIARRSVSRSLRTSNMGALKAFRPSMKISEFLVGKRKRTQKKGKGKRRRRSRTGKRRR